jgi:Na+-driven multidrug efflux pump
MALAFRGLERAEVPDASIISRIATQVGGAFGTAVLAVILESALSGANTAADAAAAFQQAFWWSTGFALAGVVLSFLLPGRAPAAAAEADRPPVATEAR